MKKPNIKQFFINWNGLVYAIPALILFIVTKVAITTFTGGTEQGYFWSGLHVIVFGLVRLVFAEFFASLLLWSNSPDAFKILFKKMNKEQRDLCTFSRLHAIYLYSAYLLGAAFLMAFL